MDPVARVSRSPRQQRRSRANRTSLLRGIDCVVLSKTGRVRPRYIWGAGTSMYYRGRHAFWRRLALVARIRVLDMAVHIRAPSGEYD